MEKRRVVITGLGTVSSIGHGIDNFRTALQEGRSGISEVTAFDTTGFLSNRGGQVKDFDPSQWIHNQDPQKLGRSSQMAVAAARMAIQDAQLSETTLRSGNTAVIVGTTNGEAVPLERLTEMWVRNGFASLDPEL